MRNTLTIQIWFDGGWHEAAEVIFHEPHLGHRGATTIEYRLDYFVEHASVDYARDLPVVDRRAASSCLPVDAAARRSDCWPSFLLDLLPQGLNRALAAAALGLPALAPSSEVELLAAVGGSPVGNVRVAGAPIGGFEWEGLPVDDVLEGGEEVMSRLRTIPSIAPAALCLQGEWPKVALVEDGGGLLHPEGALDDGAVVASYILKFRRSARAEDAAILELESHYQAAARAAGLDIRHPLRYGRDCLLIRRFDRECGQRHGQESLVSASGVAVFGHAAYHEDYLATVSRLSDDPAADVLEYVARDLVNLAFGNPDNHGRNTALSRPTTGGTRLSPLFDFAPMSAAGRAIGRSTRWACLRGTGGDHDPDWNAVSEAVERTTGVPGRAVRERLAETAARLPRLGAEVLAATAHPSAARHALRFCNAVSERAMAAVRGV